MRCKFLISVLPLLFCIVSRAQVSDTALIRESDFSTVACEEPIARPAGLIGKVAPIVTRQLTGKCYFEPECYIFAVQAVKEFGPLKGIIVTADRLTRCSRIGTSSHHHFSEDGKIHEGTEAYRSSKRKAE